MGQVVKTRKDGEMDDSRVVVWFSCGAASAVAAKLAVEKYGDRAVIVNCYTLKSEHLDNGRFFDDVQRWLGRDIVTIKSERYETVDDVIDAHKYLADVAGARCTVELKKRPRFAFQRPDDLHIFGYTYEEKRRIALFEENNPELRLEWMLRDRWYTKKRCLYALESAGVEPPAIYGLGFDNANCLGCVKASSPRYWQRTRRFFPDVFARRAEQSRRYGARLLVINGERKFLDELPDDAAPSWWEIEDVKEDLSCGPHCATN